MKNLIAVLFFVLSVPLFAQEETLLGSDHFESGGFGAPVVKFTTVNNHFGVLVGGRGGWIINHSFIIGGGGYGLVNNIEENQMFSDGKRNIKFGYGGFEIEYIFESSRMVHGSVYLLLGGGGVNYSNKFEKDYSFDWDKTNQFFVAEPAVNVELNVVSFMRLHLGASYRFVSGVNSGGLKDNDLGGPSIGLSLKFGKF